MGRLAQYRQQVKLDKRSRWSRDGLLCACVGATSGGVASFKFGASPVWLVLLGGVLGGVLGAIFGDRILPAYNL